MKLIVDEESEPQLSVRRHTAIEHLRRSNTAPLLLLLAKHRNSMSGATCNTSMLKRRRVSRFHDQANLTSGTSFAAPGCETRDSANRHLSCAMVPAGEMSNLKNQLARAQKLAEIGNIAAAVTHDVNNLLMVMSAHSELALARVADPEIKHHLNQVLDATERAAKLTRQLLAFGRERAAQPQFVNLNGVVQDLQQLLVCLLGKEIELTVLLDERLDLCKINSLQAQQILMNLVVNARDAMPNGGQLYIQTANAELNAVASSHPRVRPGCFVMLTVQDTGTGIDSSTQEHMFEPFFSTKDPGKGTGLGLAIVYEIVNRNGGQILVESEVGSGTTFRIYLPKASD